MNPTFHVGFGRTDITPAFGVPLAGYGNPHCSPDQNSDLQKHLGWKPEYLLQVTLAAKAAIADKADAQIYRPKQKTAPS